MIKNGEILGFQAIGGGLSWGSSIIKFGKPKNLLKLLLGKRIRIKAVKTL